MYNWIDILWLFHYYLGSLVVEQGGTMQEKIERLKRTKLWKFLNELNPGYANITIAFLEDVDPLLSSVVEYFPYYTRHDFEHGIEVINRISEISAKDKLDTNSENKFYAGEVFLLICAAFAHDLGMTILPHEGELKDKYNIKEPDELKKLQEYLRNTHSLRGGEYVRQKYASIGIPRGLVDYIITLMESHNMSEDKFRELNNGHHGVSLDGETIDLRKLAALLCVADLLEFSNNRVFEEVIFKLSNSKDSNEAYSYLENVKHSIVGRNLTVKDKYILISGTFDNPKVLNRIHETVDDMQRWLDFYVRMDLINENDGYLRFGTLKIIRDLKPINFIYERSSINIGKDEVIRLITSKNLWGTDYALPLREVLQNSVEACRYRESRSRICDQYRGKIEIDYLPEIKKLVFRDNGCGMSQNVIFNNFLTMSNSRSLESEYNTNHNPIARFGLGFWSVFIIANKAIVRTRAMEDTGTRDCGYEFAVDVNNLKKYTVLNQTQQEVGTSITLELKDDFINNVINIIDEINKIIIWSEVKVQISINGKVIAVIDNNILTPTIESLINKNNHNYFKVYDYLKESNIKVKFYTGISNGEIDYAIGFPYREKNGELTYLSDDGTYIFNNGSLESKYKKSVCGFIVGGLHSKRANVSGFHPVYSVFNVRNPKGFEYELRRTNLMRNEVSEKWGDEIRLIEIEKRRQFLRDFDVYNPKSIYEFTETQLLTSGYKHTYDIYDDGIKDAMDLITFRLSEYETVDSNVRFIQHKYVNLEELLKIDKELCFINCINREQFINFGYPNSYHEIKVQKYHGVNAEQVKIFEILLHQLFNKVSNNKVVLIEPDVRAFKLFLGDCESKVFFGDGIPVRVGNSYENKWQNQFLFHKFIPTNIRKKDFLETHLFGNGVPTYNQSFTAWKVNFEAYDGEYIFIKDNEIFVQMESAIVNDINELAIKLHNNDFLMAMKFFRTYGYDRFHKEYLTKE